MRIARVLQESWPYPVLALERDGALYDVAELDRRFHTQFSPEVLATAGDFQTRVIALRGAGLEHLDERLRAGDRPTEARLLPGTFVWLPPCDTDRAQYVAISGRESSGDEPRYRIGNIRGFLGHEAAVPFPVGEANPDFELGIACVLRDDLRLATVEEAAEAILGFTILNGWTARDQEARFADARGRDFGAQLGPYLVTADEVGDAERLRAQARVDQRVVVAAETAGSRWSLAESIARVSGVIELRAGDVIGAGPVHGGSARDQGLSLPYGARVELVVERLGRLSGRASARP